MNEREVGRSITRAWRTWPQIIVSAALLFGLIGALKPWGDEGPANVRTGTAAEPKTEALATEPSVTAEEQPRSELASSRPTASDGGSRTSEADVLIDRRIDDELERAAPTAADATLLDSLTVAAENPSGYDRSLFPHWDDVDDDGCDTRCEVLSAQQQPDGSWFSEWDGATEVEPTLVHIDHIVALAEAWRSGAHAWTAEDRDEFADDRTNLLAVTAASNTRKSDHDAASWFPSRADANCLWARSVVHVKARWELSVDQAELDALRNLLASCGAVLPPTTTTTAPVPSAPPPPPPPPAPTAPPDPLVSPPSADCTAGYSPCLPPASDYDCAGGSGNGPAYTGTVSVDHGFGDPYDLDRDGDGVGCE